ncbi:MAG: hypothetical protein R3D84_12305 [Paracoccaceae bacterium]
MAVAQAQQSVAELTRKLRARTGGALWHPPRRGPPAGPYVDVLLAEAKAL